ncbi:MAG: hypothetical protein K5799_07625 [Erythrobacter sp.]|nr:hypothetical protein [Erythrobacter sp.]
MSRALRGGEIREMLTSSSAAKNSDVAKKYVIPGFSDQSRGIPEEQGGRFENAGLIASFALRIVFILAERELLKASLLPFTCAILF